MQIFLNHISLADIHKFRDFPTQAQERDPCKCLQATTGHRFFLETAKRTKVILAEANKNDKEGTSFRELGQTYVNITEDKANVSCIIFKV